MVDFSKLIKPTNVKNNEGQIQNIKDIKTGSITNPEIANEIMDNNKIFYKNSDQIRVLSNTEFYHQIVRFQEKLVNDWKNTDDPEHWNSTYNHALAFYVESILERYEEAFKANNVSVDYTYRKEFQNYIKEQQEDAPKVIVDNAQLTDELTDPKDIQNLFEECDTTDIRCNKAAHTILIMYAKHDVFVEHLEICCRNCFYGGEDNFLWLIISFFEDVLGIKFKNI